MEQKAGGDAAKKPILVGIDLGTTISVARFLDRDTGEKQYLDHPSGGTRWPSTLFIGKDDVWDDTNWMACSVQPLDPNGYWITKSKRYMGKKKTDCEKNRSLPYQLAADSDGKAVIKIGDRSMHPEEIAGEILSSIKRRLEEKYPGHKIKAAISVPAYFDPAEKQATLDAAMIAGLQVSDMLIEEPAAAALANYGSKMAALTGKYVLVFDLGGGTFDVTVAEIESEKSIRVAGISGDNSLGGEDLDDMLFDLTAKKAKLNVPKMEPSQKIALRTRCKEVKELFATPSVKTQSIRIDTLLSVSITRPEFDTLAKAFVQKCIPAMQQAMEIAGIDISEIHEVLLVGGSTRLTAVKEMLEETYPGKKVNQGPNPDTIVADGVLEHALSLEEEYDGTELERSTPLPLGIAVKKDLGDVDETMSVIIDAATPLPASKTQTYYTCRHNQEWVRIQVISGWGELATDNQTLGVFAIDVPPKPQGEVSVEVKFDLNISGILKVTAIDKSNPSNVKTKEIEGVGSGRTLSRKKLAKILEVRIQKKDEGDSKLPARDTKTDKGGKAAAAGGGMESEREKEDTEDEDEAAAAGGGGKRDREEEDTAKEDPKRIKVEGSAGKTD